MKVFQYTRLINPGRLWNIPEMGEYSFGNAGGSAIIEFSCAFCPNGANCPLVAAARWDHVAEVISVIPSKISGTGRASARHFQVAVGIGVAHPIPGVLQPLGAIFLGLKAEPGDQSKEYRAKWLEYRRVLFR